MMLPAHYDNLTTAQRAGARREYTKRQGGCCAHCGAPLSGPATQAITSYPLDESTFPPNFFAYKAHLHHDHITGLTVGVVHPRCNAVLKRLHGV